MDIAMTAPRKLPEIPPGDILLHDFLEPMQISVNRLARDIDVPPSRITDIVRNGRAITMDTAVRLGIYFGTTTEFWVNLQREYDLRIAARELLPKLRAEVKPYVAIAA
jgi:antitoxin HigA-1